MEESMRLTYTQGKEAFAKKDYQTALKYLLELVEEVDGFADVWNMLGQVYHHLGDVSKAIESFEKAIAINPRYLDAQFNLAVVYSEIGRYDKAEGLYAKAKKIEPGLGDQRIRDPYVRGKLANLHAELGDLYHGLGLFGDSIREFEKALTLRPDFPDVRARLGQVLFDCGQKDRSINELKKIKKERPDFMKARIKLGLFYLSTDRKKEAAAEWKEILKDDPQNERAKMYLRLANKSKK